MMGVVCHGRVVGEAVAGALGGSLIVIAGRRPGDGRALSRSGRDVGPCGQDRPELSLVAWIRFGRWSS